MELVKLTATRAFPPHLSLNQQLINQLRFIVSSPLISYFIHKCQPCSDMLIYFNSFWPCEILTAWISCSNSILPSTSLSSNIVCFSMEANYRQGIKKRSYFSHNSEFTSCNYEFISRSSECVFRNSLFISYNF